MTDDDTATVCAATWVPSASPLEGFGSDGYAVCWVDLADGRRIQVLAASGAPVPGARGTVATRVFGEASAEVFEVTS